MSGDSYASFPPLQLSAWQPQSLIVWPPTRLTDGMCLTPGGDVVRLPAGIQARGNFVTQSMEDRVTGVSSESVEAAQSPSSPVVADQAFEPPKPTRKTGRRGKKPQGGERSPDESTMTVAESPADLRDLILLTREQAATLAGVGLNKIDEWCKEPGFPVIREGGHFVRIVREPFQQWLIELAERLNPPEQPAYRRPRKRP